MKNVGVFVNLPNLFQAVSKEFHGAKVNYEKYLAAVLNGEQLYRAFAYGIAISTEAKPFITYLKLAGFEPRYKQATVIDGWPCIRSQDWLLGMAIDIIRFGQKFDVIVIGCNDEQNIPLVHYLQERGIVVVIAACKISADLREAATSIIEINEELLDFK